MYKTADNAIKSLFNSGLLEGEIKFFQSGKVSANIKIIGKRQIFRNLHHLYEILERLA